MKKDGIFYSIDAKWRSDMETPQTMGKNFLVMLNEMSSIDPFMRDWILLDAPNFSSALLSEVAPNIQQWTEQKMNRHDDGTQDPRLGYDLTAWSCQVDGEELSNEAFHVQVNAGSIYYNSINFHRGEMSCLPDLNLITYPLYNSALKILISNWSCPWAYAKAFVNDLPPLVKCVIGPEGYIPKPQQPILYYNGAWIAYLSAPLAAGLKPPPEITAEPTPGGGVILSAVLERLEPSDPEHKRRSEILRQILLERVGENEWQADHPARIGQY